MGGEVVGRLEDFGRLAGAEGCARVLQHVLSLLRGRVRGSKHASRGPFHLVNPGEDSYLRALRWRRRVAGVEGG